LKGDVSSERGKKLRSCVFGTGLTSENGPRKKRKKAEREKKEDNGKGQIAVYIGGGYVSRRTWSKTGLKTKKKERGGKKKARGNGVRGEKKVTAKVVMKNRIKFNAERNQKGLKDILYLGGDGQSETGRVSQTSN